MSKSGLHKLLNATPNPRGQPGDTVKTEVRLVCETSSGVLGWANTALELRSTRELGVACRNAVAKAIKEMVPRSNFSKLFCRTKVIAILSRQAPVNLLNQKFNRTRTSGMWVDDATYLRAQTGRTCLVVVLELYSLTVLGRTISES
ncbi:MAG: hypothetical protein ACK517_02370 [bacterium]